MKIFFIFLAFISLKSFGQTPEKEIVSIKSKYTPEGFYFHFDKDVYISGETIWFKCYLTESGLPVTKSTALNVELLNDSGRSLQRKILPVIGSAVIGEFDLPLSLKQGHYSIRAYTQRLLNFGADHLHEQRIQVINPFNTSALTDTIVPAIHFLPEGGNMVDGLPAVVAFKASDQYGQPITVSGQIVDEKEKTVIDFSSEHDGMGKFVFIPQAGKKYSATYIYNEMKQVAALPSVTLSGATLNIQLDENKSRFIVNRTKIANPVMQPSYLLGIINNEVMFKIELPVSNSKIVTGDLPLAALPSGILQLTLFTATHQPVAERMIFVNNREYSITSVFKKDTVSFSPLKKNKFTLTLSDTSAGTYSVSVVDIGKDLPAAGRENIVSRLFLQNNIRGYVHNPLYYFQAPFNFSKQQQLDLVMLTSGWRRYNWQQVMQKQLPVLSRQDLNYISFTGKFFGGDGKKTFPNSSIATQITSKDSANEFLRFTTDSNAIMQVQGLIFTDSSTFTFQNETNSGKRMFVQPQLRNISEYFRYQHVPGWRMVPAIPADHPLTALANQQQTDLRKMDDNFKLMETIRLKQAKKINKSKIIEDRYATGLFNSGYGKLYDFITTPSKVHYRNVFEYLKVNGTGINISGSGFEYFINFRNSRSLMGGLIPATLYLDGFVVDPGVLAGIPLHDVALIKTFSSGFAGAEGGGAGGAVAVFTKKGNDRLRNTVSEKVEIKVEGFSPTKDFFSPDYSIAAPNAIDKRSTLYWNPYLTFNTHNPEIVIPFYNSEDPVAGFKIIVTGFNSEGKLLYAEEIVQ